MLHDARFPDPDTLRSLVAAGNGNDLAATGPGRSTPGAEMLAAAMATNDPRPLWVAIWGGAATLAQAVRLLREQHDQPALDQILERTWVYEIQGQDDCGAWLAATFPRLHFIRSQVQWRGISNRVDQAWPETRRYLDDYVDPRWFDRHVREGHGPLGDLYPHARFLFEGDSPSFLHLVPNGLHDPTAIQQDFAARMDWCVQPPQRANHAPRAVIDGDTSRRVLARRLKPGEKAVLDTSGSSDLAGRKLQGSWWFYREAGDPGVSVELLDSGQDSATVRAAPDSEAGECNLVYELKNEGDPPLRSYSRAVFEVV